VHIDRAACAWLIRQFIDPDAEFVFVADPADLPADATPSHARGGPVPPWGRLHLRDAAAPIAIWPILFSGAWRL